MKKTRLEAFSDGVFAIVITLLILNVRLPEVRIDGLYDGLVQMLPTLGVYMLSFLLIGMYWVFHHYAFTFISEVDGVLLWLNILFLLFISFLPFPTMMLGKYPFQTLPVVIYGANLVLVNITGFILILYLRRNKQLTSSVFTDKLYRSQMQMYLGVNSFYLGCIALAFYAPRISVYLLGIMTFYLIIRSIVMMGIGKCNLPTRFDETPGID
jgi:uncharacterized membrane protein